VIERYAPLEEAEHVQVLLLELRAPIAQPLVLFREHFGLFCSNGVVVF
jgi:hypothetical protein